MVLQAFCFSPNLIEIVFSASEIPVKFGTLHLFVNGQSKTFFTNALGRLPQKMSLNGDLIVSVIVNGPIKASDQIFFKMANAPQNIALTRVAVGFDGPQRAFLSSNVVSPLSGDPKLRVILKDSGIKYADLISGWTAPNNFYGPQGIQGTPTPAYIRIFLDNQDSSLTKEFLDQVNPGRFGEIVTFSASFRAKLGVIGVMGLHLDAQSGSFSEYTSEGLGLGVASTDWVPLTQSYTLPDLGAVAFGLYAASAVNHTQNTQPSCEAQFKDILISSNWRGVIFDSTIDPLWYLTWVSSGVAVPGSGDDGSQAYASWLNVLPNGEAEHSLILLTDNALSVVSI